VSRPPPSSWVDYFPSLPCLWAPPPPSQPAVDNYFTRQYIPGDNSELGTDLVAGCVPPVQTGARLRDVILHSLFFPFFLFSLFALLLSHYSIYHLFIVSSFYFFGCSFCYLSIFCVNDCIRSFGQFL
jgi:hypothetical protein